LASFDITGPQTSPSRGRAGFWDHGVDIQPWRLGIRPVRSEQTIRFHLSSPTKLSISRPGDFLNHASMLFLFVGTRHHRTSRPTSTSSSRHSRESINPKSGETYYLAPGSFIFGSLNSSTSAASGFWARTIVYEGSQDPNTTKAGCRNRIGTASFRKRRNVQIDASPASSVPHLVDPDERFQ